MSRFQKATRKRAKLRMALAGPSGSGKTYTALRIASGLGGRIAVVDTEHGSASIYDDVADFDVCELTDYSPDDYLGALREAEREGYNVVILDSITHEWQWILDYVDKLSSKGGNKFGMWRKATPLHNQFVQGILASGVHVIATMRSKTAYEQEGGKVHKVGMAPVQRDGIEYEFTLLGDLTLDHTLHVSKSRYAKLADKVIRKPGPDLGRELAAWLSSGEEPAKQWGPPGPEDFQPESPGSSAGPPPAGGRNGGATHAPETDRGVATQASDCETLAELQYFEKHWTARINQGDPTLAPGRLSKLRDAVSLRRDDLQAEAAMDGAA